jgi:hypothetical protein
LFFLLIFLLFGDLKGDNMMLRWLAVTFLLLVLFGATGCQEAITWVGASIFQGNDKNADSVPASQLVRQGLGARPRIRVGYLPTPTLGTVFRNPQDLGRHGYKPNWSETNGLVYTCKGGHIDIGHSRKAIDWTAFLAAKTFKQIMKNETDFSFRLYEPSLYTVRITYPQNWQNLSQADKENIANDVSIKLGQYFAFSATTWHEIITWFGFKSKGFEPEHPSAFTWEETFSNLFGVHVATLALQDAQHTFNEAVTFVLIEELQKLDVQSGHISKRASKSVRGKWFTGDFFFIDMKKRHFDLGLDDGFVTPCLIPFVSDCKGTEAQSLPVPNLDSLSEFGFSVKFEIEPRMWEGAAILKAAYPDRSQRKKRLEPVIHFAPIMDYIREDAVKRYGPDVDQCH